VQPLEQKRKRDSSFEEMQMKNRCDADPFDGVTAMSRVEEKSSE